MVSRSRPSLCSESGLHGCNGLLRELEGVLPGWPSSNETSSLDLASWACWAWSITCIFCVRVSLTLGNDSQGADPGLLRGRWRLSASCDSLIAL
jgi:hypothetical protein